MVLQPKPDRVKTVLKVRIRGLSVCVCVSPCRHDAIKVAPNVHGEMNTTPDVLESGHHHRFGT